MWCPSREHAPPDWVSDRGRPACRQERIARDFAGTSISVHTGDGPLEEGSRKPPLRSVERSSCRMACRLQDGMPMRTTRGIQDVVHNFASQFKCRRNASPAQSGPRRVPCSPTLLARSWFAHICRAVSPRPTGPAHPPEILRFPATRACSKYPGAPLLPHALANPEAICAASATTCLSGDGPRSATRSPDSAPSAAP